MKKEEIENIDWKNINDSEDILRIAYQVGDLFIEFKSNLASIKKTLYIHRDVPKDIYDKILIKFCFSKSENLPSSGATYDQLVKKNPRYNQPDKFYYY